MRAIPYETQRTRSAGRQRRIDKRPRRLLLVARCWLSCVQALISAREHLVQIRIRSSESRKARTLIDIVLLPAALTPCTPQPG